MNAPPTRVRVRLISGLVCAIVAGLLSTIVQVTPARAGSVPWGTVIVNGPDWAGQYAGWGDLNVYDNGTGSQDQNGPYGSDYECVELAQRWMAIRFHEQRIWPIGRAAEMWNAGPNLQVPLTQIPNGSSAPQFGDLVVFDATSYDPSGHVAVVADVGPGYVDVAEQNWNDVGLNRIPMQGNYMPARWGLNVFGWLRGPGGTSAPAIPTGASVPSSRSTIIAASDGTPWVSGGSSRVPFHPLFGATTAAPAAAVQPATLAGDPAATYYVVTGTDQHLYGSTAASGWTLMSANGWCLGAPGALVWGRGGVDVMTVSCLGTDHAIYVLTMPLVRGQAPQQSSGWLSLGGSFSSGPALGWLGSVPTVTAVDSSHHLETRPLTGGAWTTVPNGPACQSRPAMASAASAAQVTWLGCRGLGDQALWTMTAQGGTWSTPQSSGGVLFDGPSLVPTGAQSVVADVQGDDNTVYETTLTAGVTPSGPYSHPGWQVSHGPASVSFPGPPSSALVTEGLDGTASVTRPWGTVNLGGQLDGPPATVVDSTGTMYYIGSFSDTTLQVRTDSLGWHPLGPGLRCRNTPGAMVVNGVLTVVCQGAGGGIWSGSTGFGGPATLPVMNAMGSLGGTAVDGAQATQVDGRPSFFVTGTDGYLYRNDGQGWWAIAMRCAGRPAAASTPTTAWVGCSQLESHAFVYTAGSSNQPWTAPSSLGGVLVGPPGIAAFDDQAHVYVVGTDSRIWDAGLTVTGSSWWSGSGNAVDSSGATAMGLPA